MTALNDMFRIAKVLGLTYTEVVYVLGLLDSDTQLSAIIGLLAEVTRRRGNLSDNTADDREVLAQLAGDGPTE